MIVVVMGVAGSGKTHIGRSLAQQLGWQFFDADDFHPRQSVAKMSGGIPLTNADREPWLARLREFLIRIDSNRESAVLACSALRRAFRSRLREGISDMRFVYLRGDFDVFAARLRSRQGHFFPADLLQSQFDTLEEPDDAIVVDAAEREATIVASIVDALR